MKLDGEIVAEIRNLNPEINLLRFVRAASKYLRAYVSEAYHRMTQDELNHEIVTNLWLALQEYRGMTAEELLKEVLNRFRRDIERTMMFDARCCEILENTLQAEESIIGTRLDWKDHPELERIHRVISQSGTFGENALGILTDWASGVSEEELEERYGIRKARVALCKIVGQVRRVLGIVPSSPRFVYFETGERKSWFQGGERVRNLSPRFSNPQEIIHAAEELRLSGRCCDTDLQILRLYVRGADPETLVDEVPSLRGKKDLSQALSRLQTLLSGFHLAGSQGDTPSFLETRVRSLSTTITDGEELLNLAARILRMTKRGRNDSLCERDLKVLELYLRGFSNREIQKRCDWVGSKLGPKYALDRILATIREGLGTDRPLVPKLEMIAVAAA